MAYQVDKFNGTFLTSVADGTIDTTTDLRFVGKNYAGYGEVQNENFLHLLENFANTTSPPKVLEGQIWYDSGNKKLKFYDGTKFKSASGAEISASAPSGLGTGDFWWDTAAKQMYAWSGAEFVLIGPEASPDLGTSGVVAQVVKDTGNTNHSILKILAGGKTVGIASQTAFTLNSTTNPIDDFTAIKKGITLANTDGNGISSNDYVYWGTSSNALRLGGIEASNFLQKGNISFDADYTVSFPDNGFTLGDQNDLRFFIESGDQIVMESLTGNPISMYITDGATRNISGEFTVTGFRPGTDNIYNLGETGKKWLNVYATTVVANLTGNVTGNTTGTHTGDLFSNSAQKMIDAAAEEIGYATATLRGTLFGNVSGDLSGNASNSALLTSLAPSETVPGGVASIPVRSASGNIIATQFVGTVDKADRLKIDDTATDSDPNYKSAKTTPSNNSIAARTSAGNLNANLFQGTATSARYADLAEKYLTDDEYDAGTVMSVGGLMEVTASSEGDKAIGVISKSPAFMMNSHLSGGQFVALKGRVPVKVIGTVAKGDRLIAAADGTAKTVSESNADVFAIALEGSDVTELKLIEAVVL
jgi:hypothetical protein